MLDSFERRNPDSITSLECEMLFLLDQLNAMEEAAAEEFVSKDLQKQYLNILLEGDGEEESPEKFKPSSELCFKMGIIDSFCDFSHQIVEMPDTPCGSYSLMKIHLKALNHFLDWDCVCNYLENTSECPKKINYQVHFEIFGDSKEIFVEPSCGVLRNGERVAITVVAKPEVPSEVVEDRARLIKTQKMYEAKRMELILKREKEFAAKMAKLLAKQMEKEKGGKKGGKDKKGGKEKKGEKGGKDTKKGKSEVDVQKEEIKIEMPPLPEIVIDENSVVVDYLELYPSELVVWREVVPYFIEANFTCNLTYFDKDM